MRIRAVASYVFGSDVEMKYTATVIDTTMRAISPAERLREARYRGTSTGSASQGLSPRVQPARFAATIE
jgi:hypothetical protein